MKLQKGIHKLKIKNQMNNLMVTKQPISFKAVTLTDD